jgi:hypothetical protein
MEEFMQGDFDGFLMKNTKVYKEPKAPFEKEKEIIYYVKKF